MYANARHKSVKSTRERRAVNKQRSRAGERWMLMISNACVCVDCFCLLWLIIWALFRPLAIISFIPFIPTASANHALKASVSSVMVGCRYLSIYPLMCIVAISWPNLSSTIVCLCVDSFCDFCVLVRRGYMSWGTKGLFLLFFFTYSTHSLPKTQKYSTEPSLDISSTSYCSRSLCHLG